MTLVRLSFLVTGIAASPFLEIINLDATAAVSTVDRAVRADYIVEFRADAVGEVDWFALRIESSTNNVMLDAHLHILNYVDRIQEE